MRKKEKRTPFCFAQNQSPLDEKALRELMTLSTKLWLTTLLPLVVCLILSYTLLLISHRVREARESDQCANSVIQQMLELNHLTLQHALPSSPSPSDLPEGSSSWQESANGQLHTTLQAMLADMSDRKRLEEDLKQFQKMRSIGTLASGIAHEFNNILAAMLGYTELSQDDLPQQSPAWHNLQAVRTAGMRAKELVRQILAFSRQQPMERQPVPYGPLVKEVLSLLRVSLPKTIDIHQHIDCDAGYVIADRTQMHQIDHESLQQCRACHAPEGWRAGNPS